jgi:putative peptidoglycan lipid II flippase
MLVLLLFSEPIIVLVFQRGEFTAEDTRLVANIQFFLAFQIPFYLLHILVVRVMSAIKANKVFVWVFGNNLVVNIGLNYIFIQFIGLSGIALSTSVVYFMSWLIVTIILYKKLLKIEVQETLPG